MWNRISELVVRRLTWHKTVCVHLLMENSSMAQTRSKFSGWHQRKNIWVWKKKDRSGWAHTILPSWTTAMAVTSKFRFYGSVFLIISIPIFSFIGEATQSVGLPRSQSKRATQCYLIKGAIGDTAQDTLRRVWLASLHVVHAKWT